MIPTSNIARVSNIKTVLALASLLAFTACGKKDSGNAGANQNGAPIVDLAGSYEGRELNPRLALDDKMGRWEQVDGEWYFVPDLTLVDDSQDWEPYQHGYWSWDDEDNRGWTWVSHEPWGWMTEHYGVWRHHRRLGWIWIPFDDMEYQPHGVTWFDDGDYVGWYPYHRKYAGRYRQHPDFNDGYWDVNYAAVNFGTGNSNFRLGVTVVKRENVTRENIRRYRVSDRRQIHYVTRRVHTDPTVRARVSFSPGGLNGYLSFDFIQKQSRHKAHRGKSRIVVSKGGARFVQPFRHVDTPVEYRRRWNNRVQKYEKRHGMPGRRNFERDERFNDRRDNRRDDRRNDRRDESFQVPKREQKRPDLTTPNKPFKPQVLPPVAQPQPELQVPPRDQKNKDRRDKREGREGRERNRDQEKRVRGPQPNLNNPVVLPKPAVEVPKAEAPKAEAPKIEAPQVEAPQPETPKVEAPKVEAPNAPAEAPQSVDTREGREGRGQQRRAERTEDDGGSQLKEERKNDNGEKEERKGRKKAKDGDKKSDEQNAAAAE